MKVCSKCKESKPLDEFYANKGGRDGLRSQCKTCKDAITRAYRATKAGKEARAREGALWIKRHRPDIYLYQAQWRKENRGKVRGYKAKREYAKIQRTPAWANKKKIARVYEIAAILKEDTGIDFEIDHIAPLQGEYISGLHVENNLQILTKSENCSKGNKYVNRSSRNEGPSAHCNDHAANG